MDPGPGVDDFKGLRAYQPGDPLPRIAWKASSRGHGLLTKEFEGLFGRTPVLDWDRIGGPGVEDRLSRLCHLVLTAHNRNLDYQLRIPGFTRGPDRGEEHQHRCLEALALFQSASRP